MGTGTSGYTPDNPAPRQPYSLSQKKLLQCTGKLPGFPCLRHTYILIMSRAFVKEETAESFEDLPERPVSEHPNYVTPRGLMLIEQELARLSQEHAAAIAAEDRAAQAKTARGLRYWNARRATAQVVPEPADCSQVRFGCTVTLGRDDGRRQIFRIVGEDEAEPAHGTLSHASPLARALMGKIAGDIVPAGQHEAEILKIE
jgi:transcription elongation GreA/GreB family factor